MAKKPLPKKSRKPAAAPPKPSKPARKSPAALESELKRLDREILTLVNKRAGTTTDWIQAQPDLKKALFAPLADDALFETLAASNKGPLPAAAIRGIFRQILSAARLQVKSIRVAYLGPAYSYTHIAAVERFGESADLVPVSTIAAVFEEVNRLPCLVKTSDFYKVILLIF